MNTSDIKLNFKYLSAKGFNKDEIINCLEIKDFTYGKWARFDAIPSVEQLIKLAKISNTNVSNLLMMADSMRPIERDVESIRLKDIRVANKISQVELATALGLNQMTICDIEKGKKMPQLRTIIKLANYFKVSIDYMMGLTDYMTWDSNVKTPKLIKLYLIEPGCALHIKCGDLDSDCLMCDDGKQLIFPSGEIIDIDTLVKENADIKISRPKIKYREVKN